MPAASLIPASPAAPYSSSVRRVRRLLVRPISQEALCFLLGFLAAVAVAAVVGGLMCWQSAALDVFFADKFNLLIFCYPVVGILLNIAAIPLVIVAAANEKGVFTLPTSIMLICLGYGGLACAAIVWTSSNFFILGAICLLAALVLYRWSVELASP